MSKKNKQETNNIYEQFMQDDLANPYRAHSDEEAGKKAWQSVTGQNPEEESGEASFAQESYEEDYAIQSGEEHEQRLTEKPRKHDSLKHTCNGPQCANVEDMEDL